jgi:putative transposase
MTYQSNNSIFSSMVEAMQSQGLDGMAHALTLLLNEAMKIERSQHLGVAHYERSAERQDYANGYKPKTVKTRVGELEVAVPQVRSGDFYPSVLERGMRSERALRLAVAEMYLNGVSTRKVKEITQTLCGFEVSSTQVSRATQLLDEELMLWRQRPLGKVPYVFFDARYEKIRHGGCVVDCAVLIAFGVTEEGQRRILGVSVDLSEQEIHWRTFMESLVARGLHGIQLITSDAHSGLKAAKQAVFPSVPWQRCQFHLQQNAQAYVPRQEMKRAVASDIRSIFTAPDKQQALQQLQTCVAKYETTAPKLAAWMQEALPEGLTVFDFPEPHRRRLRTSNIAERANQSIRVRTRVARVFPNTASCLRLVSAVLIEMDEDWQTASLYLNMTDV